MWRPEPDRFILKPIHQMPGVNTKCRRYDHSFLYSGGYCEQTGSDSAMNRALYECRSVNLIERRYNPNKTRVDIAAA